MTLRVLKPLNLRFGWLASKARQRRIPVTLTVALLLMLADGLLLGVNGQLRSNGVGQNALKSGIGSAQPKLLARADMHVDVLYKGEELELNLVITQQANNDCREALKGGFCLRYSGVLDENPFLAGYGVIPPSAVRVTPTLIALDVDTRTIPAFVSVIGKGIRIAMTWSAVALTGKANGFLSATAQGTIGPYTVQNRDVVASMLFR